MAVTTLIEFVAFALLITWMLSSTGALRTSDRVELEAGLCGARSEPVLRFG